MSYGTFHCVLLYTSLYERACVCVMLAGAGGVRGAAALALALARLRLSLASVGIPFADNGLTPDLVSVRGKWA